MIADLSRALENGPRSGSDLAHTVSRRKGDVLRALAAHPDLFTRNGIGRGTTWSLLPSPWGVGTAKHDTQLPGGPA